MTEQRVLFFAPYGIWRVHNQIDRIVGWALRLRGCSILLARCDGLYGKECYVAARSQVNCESCMASSKACYDGFGMPNAQLSKYLTPDDFTLVNQWVEKFKPQEYRHAKYNGWPVGEWVASSVYTLLTVTSSALLDPLPEIAKFYKKFLVDSLITYIAFSRMVDEFKPTRIILLNGRMIPYRIALEVAKEKGIEAIIHEQGCLPQTRRFLRNTIIQNYGPAIRFFNELKGIPLTRRELEVVKKYYVLDLENNTKVTNSSYTSYYNFKDDPASVCSRLRIPPGSKMVGIFTSSECERAVLGNVVEKQLETVDKIIDLFRGRQEYLVIRHHPNIYVGSDESGADHDFMRHAYRQALTAPDNVRIIMPTEKLTSHALLWNLDAAITFFSTIGMEAVLRGIPTVSIKESPFAPALRHKFPGFSRELLSELLDALFAPQQEFMRDDLSRAYRYGYFLLKRRAFKFNMMGRNDINPPGNWSDSIPQLAEGFDPDLDSVCDQIINGGDFIKRPDIKNKDDSEEGQFIENEINNIRLRRKKVKQKSKEHLAIDGLHFGIVEVVYNDLYKNENLLHTSLRRSRYKSYSTYECVVSNRQDYKEVAEAVLLRLEETDEDYVVMTNKYFGYDESFLFTANGKFKNSQDNIDGLLLGGWSVSSDNMFEGEIFTERTPCLTVDEAIRANSSLNLPQNALSFCLFKKNVLMTILRNIGSAPNSRKALEYVFDAIGKDTIQKNQIPMVLCKVPANPERVVKNGHELLVNGRIKDAISLFKNLVRHAPDYAIAHKYLERAHRETNKLAETTVGNANIGGYCGDTCQQSIAVIEEEKVTARGEKAFADIFPRFVNELYERLDVNYENVLEKVNIDTNTDGPLIKQVKRVTFGLSNICCYSMFHKKCPLYRQKDKTVLPSKIVYKTIDELAEIDYEGIFVFHFYNEPLIDPRLFSFINYAKTHCPSSKIFILSNGFYLTQQMADELAQLGVWILAVSSYSKAEHMRLVGLDVKVPYYVYYQVLDDRGDMYDKALLNLDKPCFAPVGDITIAPTGEMVLCCLDWKYRHKFGNLNYESLSSVLNNPETRRVYLNLIQGRRNLHLCQRCDWNR